MHVSGSKGSVSGNYATDNANLLIMVGSRAVCQADCSGIGFPNTQAVININGDLADVSHYNRTVMLPGDIGAIIIDLLNALNKNNPQSASEWLTECAQSKKRWRDFKDETCSAEPLFDSVWQSEVLTQPTAIKVVADYAKTIDAVKYFDAGDVQANGFQIAEDDHPCQTFTETGASYMGFAVNALMAAALADNPQYGIAFTGDGSFMMNPQILIDGIEHGLRGMIVIFDNRRMAAITALQEAQYGNEYRTSDRVAVDYVAMASAIPGILALSGGTSTESLRNALKKAGAYTGLSLVHIPVYYGPAPRCGLGAYGSWNVGNWVAEVQAKYHQQNL
jgi:3D-(3,5/4)-trihydroxycyclohexane-1,2-dione acylhydrolase (decyclizing)